MPTSVQSSGVPNRLGAANRRGVKRIEKKAKSLVGKGVKPSKKRPEWDWSSKDLNAHRLSKEDLEKRHLSHQSKNLELAKHELYDKAKNVDESLISRGSNMHPSPLSSSGRKLPKSRRVAESRRLLTLQRSLHDRELHDVLARSDDSMRVVRDLFGDDPKRYTCQPNVTAAPSLKQKLKAELNSRETVLQLTQLSHLAPGEGVAVSALDSPGGIWDDSVRELLAQRKPALNDSTLLHGREEELGVVSPSGNKKGAKSTRVADLSSIDVSGSEPQQQSLSGDYKPQVDLRRFQQLLEQEEKSHHSGGNIPTNIANGDQAVGLPPTIAGRIPDRAPLVRGPLERSDSGGIRRVAESEYHKESTWCDDSAHSGRGQEGVAPDDGSLRPLSGSAGASEMSAYPLGTSVGSGEDPHGKELANGRGSSSVRFPGKIPATLDDKMDGKAEFVNTVLAMGGQGSVDDLGEEKEEVEGDEGTLVSQNTSKIHADLSRLEQLVRDLDHKLERSKQFLPNSEPQQVQKRSQQQAPPASAEPGKLAGNGDDVISLLSRVRDQLETSDRQLEGEMVLRGQFLQTLSDQQDLLDAMATDLLQLQRDNTELRQDVAQVKVHNAEEVARLKGEVANLRSALFLVLQQNPAHPLPTSATPLSQQDQLHDVQGVNSQMTRDVMAQLLQERAPPTSSTNSTPAESVRNLTTLPSIIGNASLTTASQQHSRSEPTLSQTWVELTPTPDYISSSVKQENHKFSDTPQGTSGKSHDRVVYAQVSPLSYSEHNASGKGLHIVGSRSSSSLPVVSSTPASGDSFVTSLSASQLEGVASSHATIHAPLPPPVSVAVLSPPIPQSSLTIIPSHITTSVSNRARSTPTGPSSIVSKSNGHVDLFTDLSNCQVDNASQSEKSNTNQHKTGLDYLQELQSSTDGGENSCTDQHKDSSEHIPRAKQETSDTGFDVAGLLQSLQELEKFRVEAANQVKPPQELANGSSGKGFAAVEHRPVHSRSSNQYHMQDSLTTQSDTICDTTRQQRKQQQPVMTQSSGLLLAPPAQPSVASHGAEPTREYYKALTPITEESTLTNSFIEEESCDRSLSVTTGSLRNENKSRLQAARHTAVHTAQKSSPGDVKVSRTLSSAKPVTASQNGSSEGLSGEREATFRSVSVFQSKHREDGKKVKSVPDTWFSLSAHLTQ